MGGGHRFRPAAEPDQKASLYFLVAIARQRCPCIAALSQCSTCAEPTFTDAGLS